MTARVGTTWSGTARCWPGGCHCALTPVRPTASWAHTDSPGFAIKPNPDIGGYGYQQLGVEVYGGPLLNSWLDRELGLAGRVVLADGRVELVRTDAIMRIPQLAIHLDRGVNDNGLKLDKQLHTAPIWGVGRPDRRLVEHVADLVDGAADEVHGLDLMAYDATPPTRSTASTWWPTTPRRLRCSDRIRSSWLRDGWTT